MRHGQARSRDLAPASPVRSFHLPPAAGASPVPTWPLGRLGGRSRRRRCRGHRAAARSQGVDPTPPLTREAAQLPKSLLIWSMDAADAIIPLPPRSGVAVDGAESVARSGAAEAR